MAKRPRKPRTPPPSGPISLPLFALLQPPPAAVAQRERSWTVAAADDLLDEFSASPSVQAAELRKKAEVFDQGPEAALAIAEEMERRARVGVRRWPGSEAARRTSGVDLKHTVEAAQAVAPDDSADPPAPDDFG